MNAVLALSLTGAGVSAVTLALDLILARGVTAGIRRACLLIIPVAFLVPFRLGLLPRFTLPAAPVVVAKSPAVESAAATVDGLVHSPAQVKGTMILSFLWVAGAGCYLGMALLRSQRVRQQWSRVRLSTDPVLLGLLEDCKVEAGVTVPLGLVVTDAVASPAILGWLRPRFLLPADLARTMSRDELRFVFLHELAHVKSSDIAVNWLFVLVGAVHWFNPLAYITGWYFRRFAEEAADERAMRWSGDLEGSRYGEALLAAIRPVARAARPYGVFALGETFSQLKHRLTMIRSTRQKKSRRFLGCLVATCLLALVLVRPAQAADDPATAKKEAVAAMTVWLGELDAGAYGQTWTDASAKFQSLVTQATWTEKASAVRTPLGKCTQRVLLSALYNAASANAPQGYVLAQFKTSFENLALATETVTFMKEGDHWKVIGYYVKPAA